MRVAGSYTSLEDIKEWLVNGVDNPDTIVDLRWHVLDEKKEDGKIVSLRVTHPSLPLDLTVTDLERQDYKSKVVRLSVSTGIYTVDLDQGTKATLYRKLLLLSKVPLVKPSISGEDHEIILIVDLDKKDLSKEEFDEALNDLLTAFLYLAKVEPLSEMMEAKTTEVLQRLVAKWHEKGKSRIEAIRALTKAGLDQRIAEEIVNQVYPGAKKERLGDMIRY